ncbi:TetR/AcrR family transcriptional regulator [Mycolicibacterium sp. CBMA 226]|uniref:TetR/AcrR family transcriptional regulator n=1 Tax=Mycolicibacterium sp. CBMA 226 TaxID=2606611 RepID=UPI0012DCD86E|nr:TetR/AcrR family transcriptional regulator [Mycolicibacterium sp. CBMA 226]MUL74946.1 TetR/AcrR family transcriptional regulator [Mycolicibacterium sp. CBMA 226]
MTPPPTHSEPPGLPTAPRRTRRDEYAEQTRQAVVDAARKLFAERGYFAATVNEIAEASRVSPGTVYQQCGGKQGLLRTLMDIWTTSALVQQTLDAINAADTVEAALEVLADAYLEFFRQFDDIIQVVLATAPHDAEAASALDQATLRHRTALQEISARVRELGDFPASFTDTDFTDLAIYYYGPQSGYHFTVAVLGWSEARARDFLHTQFGRSLHEAVTAR